MYHQSFLSNSVAGTQRFAAALAPKLGPGDTILLRGGLGAGKTHFARCLLQARLAASGLVEDVPSPTFTLVQTYNDGNVEIWHCDLYRLAGRDEVSELGLDEAFTTSICLIEWPESLGALAPANALSLTFSMTEARGVRAIEAASADVRWADLLGGCVSECRDGD